RLCRAVPLRQFFAPEVPHELMRIREATQEAFTRARPERSSVESRAVCHPASFSHQRGIEGWCRQDVSILLELIDAFPLIPTPPSTFQRLVFRVFRVFRGSPFPAPWLCASVVKFQFPFSKTRQENLCPIFV